MDYQIKTPDDHPDKERLEKVVNHLLNFINAEAVYISYKIIHDKPVTIITTVINNNSDLDSEMLEYTNIRQNYPDYIFTFCESWFVRYAFKKGRPYFIFHCSSEELAYLAKDGRVFQPSRNISYRWQNKIKKRFAMEKLDTDNLLIEYENLNSEQDLFKTAVVLHRLIRNILYSISGLTETQFSGNAKLTPLIDNIKDLAPSLITILKETSNKNEILETLSDVFYINRSDKTCEVSPLVLERGYAIARILYIEMNRLYEVCLKDYAEKLERIVTTDFAGSRLFSDKVPSDYLIESSLSLIASEITSFMKTRAIYCFGYKRTPNEDYKTDGNQYYKKPAGNHYYILALYEEYRDDAVQRILSRIYGKYGKNNEVTLLLHSYKASKKKNENQRYFFSKIIENGIRVYESQKGIAIEVREKANFNTEISGSYWHDRIHGAEVFLQLAATLQTDSEALIKNALLYQSIEQIVLGLLSVFTGYQPNRFSLRYLFDLLHYLTDINLADEFFDDEGSTLFQQLSANPEMLKFKTLTVGSCVDSVLLEEKSVTIYNRSKLLIQNEIEQRKLKIADNSKTI